MVMDSLLSFENLEFRYGNGADAVVAIQDLSLSIGRGEFISIIGQSGCGKSTLLRIAAGLLHPTGGSAVGESIGHAAKAEGKVGLMFQTPVLMPWLSILDNVMLIEELRGNLNRDERRELEARALEVLNLVGLSDFKFMLPNQLSGGMQQRAALARALVLEPEVLFLDEPFGALDALTRADMSFELQRIWLQKPTTVILVTHDIPEAVLLADRVVVMSPRPGRVVGEVAVQIERPRTLETKESREYAELIATVSHLLHSDFSTKSQDKGIS